MRHVREGSTPLQTFLLLQDTLARDHLFVIEFDAKHNCLAGKGAWDCPNQLYLHIQTYPNLVEMLRAVITFHLNRVISSRHLPIVKFGVNRAAYLTRNFTLNSGNFNPF
jgi:hypothetical protein